MSVLGLRKDRARSVRALVALVILIVGMGITGAIVWRQRHDNQEYLQKNLNGTAAGLAQQLGAVFSEYDAALRGARAMVLTVGPDQVTAADFKTYADSVEILRSLPGALGIGYITVVVPGDAATFQEAARVQDPTFTIRQLGPNDGPLYVIEYIEPRGPNAPAVGLDIASEPNRRTAADTAAATGATTATAPITMVQAQDARLSAVLVLTPVYRSGAPTGTEEERRAAVIGWTYAPAVAADMLAGLHFEADELAIALVSSSPDGAQTRLYATPGFDQAAQGNLNAFAPLPGLGNKWDIQVSALPGFAASENLPNPLQLAAAGALATLFAAITAYLIALGVQRQRSLIAQRAELQQGKAIAEQRERMEYILAGMDAGTWEWHVPTGRVLINERWARIVGEPLEELEPATLDTWLDRVHAPDLSIAREAIDAAASGASDVLDCEVRIDRPDGRPVWVHDRGRVTTWLDDGGPEWVYGTRVDVTESRLMQRRLAESQEILERTGELARVGGWRLSLDPGSSHPELDWSEELRRLFEIPADYTPTEADLVEQLAPASRPAMRGALDRARSYGAGWDLELQAKTWDERTLWIRSVGASELRAGQPIAIIGAIQDITDRHEAAEALREAKSAAETANRAKSQFLANTSHEIRTPMNALLGLTYLLRESQLTPEQRDLVAKIDFAGTSLSAVINDVLDLTKIEAGEMSLEHLPMSLAATVEGVVALMTAQAEVKGVELSSSVDPLLPSLVLGDAVRIRQIVTNLVGNAIKFTERGGSVRVTLEHRGEIDDHVLARLSVTDTGIGVPPEVQRRLFQAFSQADPSTNRTHGGTGLGLSIVSHLAGLMGGDAGVDSKVGAGSTFWVEIPLRPAEREDPRAAFASGISVLIAEDDEQQRHGLAHLTSNMGWATESVSSGRDLTEVLRARIGSGRSPDVVLADWHLNDMDAFQSLQAVVTELGADDLPAIVVITGRNPEDASAAPFSGLAAAILPKPVDPSRLFNAVSDAVAGRSTEDEGGGTVGRGSAGSGFGHPVGSSETLRGRTIMVVDDSDLNLLVARRILELAGATVVACASGPSALEVLGRNDAGVEVVLLDVQMPSMDGYEVVRRIRSDLGLRTLPVLALTAGALLTERNSAIAAGMDGFLTKPLDPGLLIATIAEHLGPATGSTVAPPSTEDSVPDQPDSHPGAWPAIPGIDVQAVRHRLGDDWGLFLDLADQLLTEGLGEVPAMVAEGIPEDRTLLGRRMHALKGSAGMLGMDDLFHLAADAETACREGAEDETIASLVSRIVAAMTQLSTEIMSVAGVTESIGSGSSSDDAAPATATPTRPEFQDLVAMLRAQDLAALDLVADLAGPLTAMLGTEGFAELKKNVRWLRFDTAADALTAAGVPDVT